MKNLINNRSMSQSSDELEFAYKVRRALDEQITALPESTTNRLSAARKLAIARKKPESVAYATVPVRRFAGAHGGSGNPLNDSLSWLVRVGIIVPLIVLVIGAFGIYKYEEERRIDELADLDAAVLSDELPLNAYLDHGFDTYLNKHGE
jgi:predicted ATPase